MSIERHGEESHKGKHKPRKRRRLQQQNRVLKEFRKNQKMDAATDEDFGAYSSDGSDRIFSEDENMGARTCDASLCSSDEMGVM